MNALLLAAVIAAPPSADALKCGRMPNTFPGYDPAAPVVLVDDRVLPASEGLGAIGKLDIGRIEVSCWNPDTGEIGEPPAIPLVLVATKSWCAGSADGTREQPADEASDGTCPWREDEQRAALRSAYGADSARPDPPRPMDRITDLRHLGPHDELGVYSVILQDLTEKIGEWSYVVVAPTAPPTRLTDPILAVVREKAGAEATFAADEGERILTLEDAERLGVELFDAERVSRAQTEVEGNDFWEAVGQTYPAGLRLVRLNRPAFSPDGESAVVYYGSSCGGRCGGTHLALVSRVSGQWAVLHSHPMVLY